MFQVCLNWLPLLYKRVDWKVLPPTPFSCSLGVQLNYRLSHSRILIFSANFWLSGEMCTVRLQSLSCKSVGFVISIRKMQILREATIAIHLFLIFFLPKNMLGTPEKERESMMFLEWMYLQLLVECIEVSWLKLMEGGICLLLFFFLWWEFSVMFMLFIYFVLFD